MPKLAAGGRRHVLATTWRRCAWPCHPRVKDRPRPSPPGLFGPGHLVIAAGFLVLSCVGGRPVSDDPCASVDCPGGEECVDGVCVPQEGIPECIDDTDCADNWVCEEGVCAPEPSEDPCESVTCPEGQQCVDGVCTVAGEGVSCSTDEDCPNGEVCYEGTCTSGAEGASEIALANPSIDFDALSVGETYPLLAPEPTVATEETDSETEGESESGTESEVGPDESSEGDGEDGATPAEELTSVECSCSWAAVPVTAAGFDPADDCTAEMTPLEAGEFVVAVTVTCADQETQFTQLATASIPPTPCTANEDCAEDERCSEGICIARTGPVVTVLAERSRAPFLVIFDLRLEELSGAPIHEGVVREQFRIFEDDQELDYAETGYSVTSAPNLPLKIVLVLDYTVSMEDAGAVNAMVTAAREFVQAEHITATHQIALIEFHDRTDEGEGYGLVAPLTRADEEGKSALAQAIPVEGALEPGLSRVWDAVDLAITVLGETERQPGERQAIVFLTDGRDTTSEVLPESILSSAKADEIMLYPIGFGEVAANEVQLQSLADETEGTYFPAQDADAVTQAFADIARDLRGQWTLSYISQKNTGTVHMRGEFTWEGQTDRFETDINVGSLDGDIHAAVIEVLERDYDDAADATSFLLKAAYVPRNVSRFRFFIAQDGSTFAPQGPGGLTPLQEGWGVIGSEGTYDLVGTEPLDYGAFGNIGVVSLPGDVAQLQIAHDDSVYESLPQPKTVVFEGDLRAAPAALSIVVDPPEAGVVGVSPDKFAYAQGESVSLVASAFGNYAFDSWAGGASGSDFTTTVTMDGDQTVTAQFFSPHTLTVSIDPAGAGTITRNPDKETYRHGEVVILTAVASGATFTSWSGAVTGTDTSVSLVMDGDKTVTATFTVSE